jgi:hypothetical protein
LAAEDNHQEEVRWEINIMIFSTRERFNTIERIFGVISHDNLFQSFLVGLYPCLVVFRKHDTNDNRGSSNLY